VSSFLQFCVPVCDQHQRRRTLGDRIHHQESAVTRDVVCLGCNGVANAGRKQRLGRANRSAPELVLEPLKRTIKQRALEKSPNEVQLKISHLGSEAGALGAGRLISEIVVERLYVGNTHSQ
jgi:hypothetical protein